MTIEELKSAVEAGKQIGNHAYFIWKTREGFHMECYEGCCETDCITFEEVIETFDADEWHICSTG